MQHFVFAHLDLYIINIINIWTEQAFFIIDSVSLSLWLHYLYS